MSSASPYSLGDGASPSLNDTSHTPNYKNPASRKPQVFAVQLSMTCISFLFVALRIATKTSLMKLKRAFRLDDILIVFALTVSIVMTALCLIATTGGYGLHYWDIPPGTDTNMAHRLAYVNQLLNISSLSVTKISLLAFYLQLNPEPKFQERTRCMIWICTFFGLANLLADIFQCWPVNRGWEGARIHGTCDNLATFYKCIIAINVFLEIIIFLMPMPMLWRLHLPVQQRIALMCTFGVGIFLIGVSSVRFALIFASYLSLPDPDTSWSRVTAINWACIEYNVSIICACLPHLKPILMRVFPERLRSYYLRRSGDTLSQQSQQTISPQTSVNEMLPVGVVGMTRAQVLRGPSFSTSESSAPREFDTRSPRLRYSIAGDEPLPDSIIAEIAKSRTLMEDFAMAKVPQA